VAGFLDLDVVTVREGLTKKREQAEKMARENPNPIIQQHAPVAGVKAAVDTVTNAVQQKVVADQRVGRRRGGYLVGA
jgi:hypothetical protein